MTFHVSILAYCAVLQGTKLGVCANIGRITCIRTSAGLMHGQENNLLSHTYVCTYITTE